MTTQQDLDNAGLDAQALTRFMTDAAGTINHNSQGVNIGTLADANFAGAPQFGDVQAILDDVSSHAVGSLIFAMKEGAVYRVTDGSEPAHIITAGGVELVHTEGPYVIAITGQSNAAGSNDDGPNPASSLVHVWDGVTGDWGSSDRTQNPLARSNPDGNQGNNNYALARAHRVAQDTGRPVLVIYDALGGQPISEWVGSGTLSPRYAALTSKITAAISSPLMTAFGKTSIDELILAQGEADYNDPFDVYLDKLQLLRDQIRAESWFSLDKPIYMMSPSDLHDRYQWRDAMVYLCTQRDNRSIFVTANGLRTEYGLTGSGDNTHFLGESLWEAGFHRIADAAPTEGVPTCFYGRGTGPVDATDTTAMTTFSTIVSRDSWTTEIPPNGPAATGSISWGHECAAEGNYSFAFGYQCVTDNLANYGLLAGRLLNAGSTADYFGAFGYQNSVAARYTMVSGRGNTAADEGGTIVGLFAEYVVPETDPVMFQVGTGASTSTRKSAVSIRKSGAVEMKLLSEYADNAAAIADGASVGTLYRTNAGDIKVVV